MEDEELAKIIASWHGHKMVVRRDGITHTVASLAGFGQFAGAGAEYANRHWKEYVQAAQAVKKTLVPEAVKAYWLEHYVNDDVGLCSLCGNTGKIDTTATAISPAGVLAGRVDSCICPNGQHRRAALQETASANAT